MFLFLHIILQKRFNILGKSTKNKIIINATRKDINSGFQFSDIEKNKITLDNPTNLLLKNPNIIEYNIFEKGREIKITGRYFNFYYRKM